MTSYNLNTTYLYWAEGLNIKPLPEDLSKWPNVKKLIEGTRDVEYLKYNGRYYGIPVARNINRAQELSFSPFTYMYRRDIAKELGVYKENDIYSWEDFNALLTAFKPKFASGQGYALGDAEWGYPSILNFYKTAPHCFANNNGTIVNNYYTTEYLQGLEVAKGFVSSKIYDQSQMQNAGGQNMIKKNYTSKKLGIYYENLSMSNYLQIRDEFTKNGVPADKLDDYTAIMKVKGPDGKYALEGQEDWFSMTFFNYDISDSKMEKILDIMDWLLSDEGTKTALYGIEGVDYEMNGNEVNLLDSDLWAKNNKGEYIDSPNGARYLRYMVTLGHDIIDKDPLVKQSASKLNAYNILTAWENEMSEALANNQLRVLFEDPQVKWMQTPKKIENAGKLLEGANTMVLQYTFDQKKMNDYRSKMTSSDWNSVLNEINGQIKK